MKIFKSIIILIACIALSACQNNDKVQETANIQTEPPATQAVVETTVQQEETVYDRYPELSEYDVFSQYYSRAEEILSDMTVAQKVGQMFWIRCPEDSDTALEYIQQYNLGGYVLFANHFENSTPYSIKKMTESFQSASAFPMALSCDEEGGDIVRISKYSQFRNAAFFSPQMLYQIGGIDEIVKDIQDKSAFLKDLGINVNLAPVADVSENAGDYIYSRTFGKNADETGQYIKSSVRAYNESGLTCVLKHFPGYGSNGDTHTTSSIDEREYSEFTSKDFIPFIEGIKMNAPFIMINHNTVACMDTENPASLSPNVHNILRSNLGFTGIIITDDLEMSAVYDKLGEVDACLKAIDAGNDIICTSAYESGIPAVVKAAETGKIPEQRVNTSVIRILAWKLSFGIMQ